ncbi:DUF2490 domain-containing protein [Sphingomonas immobilis]|uniref:DUF2490 domain-containing protein n=1 Tax=Sphingomonas immobilis TaxID=3063997 RepID=A0ABT8ZWD3_9SPHN|nr:DUF2490 domain-containing protein [Sphingomonas sp. CA1-15]MDO7841871.1 DUF2490 domain-containing protein [Sphingomonas sp. CA1-15]
MLIAAPAFANDDAQLWTSATATVNVGSHVRVSEEVVTRFSDFRHGLYEVESNTLLGYRVAPHVTVWAGYTHDPLYDGGKFLVMERRAREQITYDDLLKLGPGIISARLRIEQRWRDGLAGTGWRVRPFIRYVVPLRPGSRTALAFSHENFVGLNSVVFRQATGEERMRNAVTLALPIAHRATFEIGYLNQHAFAGTQETDHAFTLAIGRTL